MKRGGGGWVYDFSSQKVGGGRVDGRVDGLEIFREVFRGGLKIYKKIRLKNWKFKKIGNSKKFAYGAARRAIYSYSIKFAVDGIFISHLKLATLA